MTSPALAHEPARVLLPASRRCEAGSVAGEPPRTSKACCCSLAAMEIRARKAKGRARRGAPGVPDGMAVGP